MCLLAETICQRGFQLFQKTIKRLKLWGFFTVTQTTRIQTLGWLLISSPAKRSHTDSTYQQDKQEPHLASVCQLIDVRTGPLVSEPEPSQLTPLLIGKVVGRGDSLTRPRALSICLVLFVCRGGDTCTEECLRDSYTLTVTKCGHVYHITDTKDPDTSAECLCVW